MPVVKRKGGGYKVKGTNTRKRQTKKEAKRQLRAIEAEKHKRRKK